MPQRTPEEIAAAMARNSEHALKMPSLVEEMSSILLRHCEKKAADPILISIAMASAIGAIATARVAQGRKEKLYNAYACLAGAMAMSVAHAAKMSGFKAGDILRVKEEGERYTAIAQFVEKG